MEQRKALIAMSGGVDSSVAAYLTQQAGFCCIGANMRLYDAPDAQGSCCSADDAQDARSVAYRLGMPFYVFNFTEDFRCHVVDSFVRSYEAGLTPNPCVACNRHLKFGRLLRRAQELGCDYVVTGHYARVSQSPETGRYLLQKAADRAKDQSYFLCCLTQAQLSHVRFPLGELTKEEVRAIAQAQGFRNAGKRDSQDICFVPDGDYLAFLQAYNGKPYPAGDFLDASGHVVGRHRGAAGYTLGQRKGLGLAMGQPVYVCGKDMQHNTVTVGAEAALFHTTLLASDWFWFPFPALDAPMRVCAKARSRMAEQPATVYPLADGFARVEFDEPQRAITPGQAVVLYDGDTVVGGGTITEVLP
ncbi:MAG: tRNA 2-thiouridine(34) synthase MnmA [Firmicutes bacterium]|nr:tRNA 2-thiouridine(34) synthase MnmA [Bacillota bacterium]